MMGNGWLLKNSLIVLTTRILAIAGEFVLSVMLARALGPTDRGMFAMYNIIGQFAFTIFNLGVFSSANYHISAGKLEKSKVMSNVLLLNTTMGLAATWILFLFRDLLSNKLGVSEQLILLSAISVPALILSASFSAILYASKKIFQISLWSLIYASFQVFVFFVVLFVVDLDIDATVLTSLLLMYTNCVGLGTLALKTTGVRMKLRLYNPVEFVKFGITVSVGRLIQFFSYRLDTIFVSAFLGVTALGYYSISSSVAEQLWIVPNSINLLLMPMFCGMITEQSSVLAAKVSRNMLFITTIMALFLSIIAIPLIPALYGDAFTPAVWPFLLLLPGVVVLTLIKVLEPFCQANARPDIPAKAALFAVILNSALNIVLTPAFGIVGTAIASSIAYFLQATVIGIGFLRISKMPFQEVLFLKKDDWRNFFVLPQQAFLWLGQFSINRIRRDV